MILSQDKQPPNPQEGDQIKKELSQDKRQIKKRLIKDKDQIKQKAAT